MSYPQLHRKSQLSPLRAIILTAERFEDIEVFFPYYRLLEEGVEVDVAAPQKGVIHGEHGYSLKIAKTIDEVDPDLYDLLVIPGGSPNGAPATVRKIVKAQEIAKSFFAKNKPVASICHGPWLLVSADLVRGRHLTSYWHDGVPEDIKAAGGIYEDKEVVVDGNLVTSRSSGDLPFFSKEMVKLIKKEK
jgi:protease I